jgi:hypothetical protein
MMAITTSNSIRVNAERDGAYRPGEFKNTDDLQKMKMWCGLNYPIKPERTTLYRGFPLKEHEIHVKPSTLFHVFIAGIELS